MTEPVQVELAVNPIEAAARDEYREGVSPGAAARQLCRMLGAMGYAPTLKRMLEDMLAEQNRASHVRAMITLDVERVAGRAAAEAIRSASFNRTNRRRA